MTKLIWSERHWRNRAEDARASLPKIRNPDRRRIVGDIAATYDHLAELTRQYHEAAAIKAEPPRKPNEARDRSAMPQIRVRAKR